MRSCTGSPGSMRTGADSGGLDRASGIVEEQELSMVMTLSYRATVDRAVGITRLAPTLPGNGPGT